MKSTINQAETRPLDTSTRRVAGKPEFAMPALCPRKRPGVKSLFSYWGALLVALVAIGCGGGASEPESPKEIYDVPPVVEIPIADDPQEVRRPPGLSGRLPAG
ncbi:MAG: hypothetical protein AAFY88_21295, partial [Acidobacteriota bacterium]